MINVMICITDNLWQQACVTINSILSNTDQEVTIYLVYSELMEVHKTKISSLVSDFKQHFVELCLNDKNINTAYEKVRTGAFPIESCYRILAIPYLEGINKIIYMDVDVVVDGDISELWNIDFDGKYIIASQSNRIDQTYYKCYLGNPFNAPYVYSGLLIMDVDEIRKHLSVEDLIDFWNDYDSLTSWVDMDFINVFFEGKIKVISQKYHSMSTEFPGTHMNRTRSENRRLVLHWPGYAKPWNEFSKTVYLHDLSIYLKYCNVEYVDEAYIDMVKHNIVLYENNQWIPLENRDRYDAIPVSNQRAISDYFLACEAAGKRLPIKYMKDNNIKAISLYGFNDIARLLVNHFNCLGIRVKSIVDRNKPEISYNGIPILYPTEFKQEIDDENENVLVCVVNEFENIVNYMNCLGIMATLRPFAELIFWDKIAKNKKEYKVKENYKD